MLVLISAAYHVDNLKLVDYERCLRHYGRFRRVERNGKFEFTSIIQMYCTDHKLHKVDTSLIIINLKLQIIQLL